jgi:hypothetical protein
VLYNKNAKFSADSAALQSGRAAAHTTPDALQSGRAAVRAGLDALQSGRAAVRAGLDAFQSGRAAARTGLDALRSGRVAAALTSFRRVTVWTCRSPHRSGRAAARTCRRRVDELPARYSLDVPQPAQVRTRRSQDVPPPR